MTLNPKITVNRRHQRTMQILAIIMPAINKYIHPNESKPLIDELLHLINNSGMEIITDDMRKEAGLEPRNENGCTPLELMLIEYFFMCRMLKPIIVQFPPPVTPELIDQNAVWLPCKEPTDGYPSEMIDAGIKYLNERSFMKNFEFPGRFNWHDFISTMLSAIKRDQ